MSIRKMSLFALILTVVLSLFVSVVSFFGWYEFKTLVEATEQYAECQSAAAKMEDAINKMEDVYSARVNFMPQKLTIDVADDKFEATMDAVQKAISNVEPDCRIIR